MPRTAQNQFKRGIAQRLNALEQSRITAKTLQKRIEQLNILQHIAEVYYPLHEDISKGMHEFYNLPGGRGSGKSSFCALELIYQIMKNPSGNALIVRKWAVTLRGSVFSQIQWAIDTLEVGDLWISTILPMQFIYKPTGQVIRLTGLDDPQKLKSIKPAKGYFRYLWMEEFSEITGEMELRNLQQSVLRGGDVFTVFRSFNPPISRANWANTYIQIPDDRSITLRTDYTQIPSEWLGQAFIEEAQRLKKINPRAYINEYLGIANGNGSEVFETLEVRKISDAEYKEQTVIKAGIDWGFSSDPVCFLRVSYDRKTDTIRILDEIYRTHVHNDQLADLIKSHKWDKTGQFSITPITREAFEERQLIIADSAEPKSIDDMNRQGLKVIKCTKFQGCIQYRLKWLQRRRIIVDPSRTPNTARELQNYCYEVDRRTGEVLPSVPDLNNHSIDALSYALDREIYTGKNSA